MWAHVLIVTKAIKVPVIVCYHLKHCLVQYLDYIRLTMEQSDWLVLFIGPLN